MVGINIRIKLACKNSDYSQFTHMKAFLLRTFILLCCTFGSTINLFAQDEITIESCKESTGENIAEAQPRNDINGNPCAVFQIETNDLMGLTFPNKNQYVGEVRQSNGTYYVYVPGFSYKLDFQHPDFIPGTISVAPFGFKKSITGGKTYIIKLKAPQKIDNAPHVSFKVSPFVPGTSIVFDGNRKELKQNTDLKFRCNSGTYNYRVEAPNYQTETGTIEVKKGAVPISVQLKPSTVQVNIKCNVSNANVYVDNEHYGSVGVLNLPQGTHKIRLTANGYLDNEVDVFISNSTYELSYDLNKNKGETINIHPVNVIVHCSSYKLYKNNKPIPGWSDGEAIKLMPGSKCRLSNDNGQGAVLHVQDHNMEIELVGNSIIIK